MPGVRLAPARRDEADAGSRPGTDPRSAPAARLATPELVFATTGPLLTCPARLKAAHRRAISLENPQHRCHRGACGRSVRSHQTPRRAAAKIAGIRTAPGLSSLPPPP